MGRIRVCLANKKVAEEISLRHASHILLLFIQDRNGSISMCPKTLQPLTDRIVLMEKHSGDLRNHDFNDIIVIPPCVHNHTTEEIKTGKRDRV